MTLSLRYINRADSYLKCEIGHFAKWLRANYEFSVPLEVRLVNSVELTDFDGKNCALRWWQNEKSVKVEIAVGSFQSNLTAEGPEVAFPTVIAAMGRAIYYYNQATKDIEPNEKQATRWGDRVMNAYIDHKKPPAP